MVKLVDTHVSGACGASCAGSSPAPGTKVMNPQDDGKPCGFLIQQQVNLAQLQKDFIAWFGRDAKAERVYFSPGRVCLIGEHIDYNGGLVIPAAISLGIYAVARRVNNHVMCMKSSLDNREVIISLQDEILPDKKFGWANYPLGMAQYFIRKGHHLQGCEIMFCSTLPVGAGLSSSAAIEVLTGLILADLNNIPISKKDLALAAKEVENNFVGVQCGIMDQFAVSFGEKDKAIRLNCTTLDYELLPLELKNYQLVIFNTNKKRELADSIFNERVAECNEAFRLIAHHENISCLADADLDMVHKYVKDATVNKRAVHVMNENKRVADAAAALKSGNIEHFGKLLFESHESLRSNYEVSGKELDAFVDFAKQFSGCLGAKMTGAGFGGCAVAIVENTRSESFIAEAEKNYKNKTGLEGKAFTAQITDGVLRMHV
jgi:galactokinase